MSLRTLRTTRLYVVAATTQMVLGLSVYAFPHSFADHVYDQLRPYFPVISAIMVGGGVLQLGQSRLPPRLRRVLVALPGLILLGISAASLPSRAWSAPIGYGLLGLAVLAAAFAQPAGADAGEEQRDLWDLTGALMVALVGATYLFNPGAYAMPAYVPLLPYMRLIGTTGLLAGSLLALCCLRSGPCPLRLPARVLGAVLPLVTAWSFWVTDFTSGVLVWCIWGAAILTQGGAMARAMERPAAPIRTDNPWDRFPDRMEQTLEHWMWVLPVAVLCLTAFGGAAVISDRLAATIFVLAISIYNAIAFRGFHGVLSHRVRLLSHLSFLTLSVSLLLLRASPVGHGLLAMLVLLPSLAARTLGLKDGTRLLMLTVLSVIGANLLNALRPGSGLEQSLAVAALEAMLVWAIGNVGMKVALDQRQVAEELTVRKAELEDALAQARRAEAETARLAAILEATPDFVGMSDGNGRRIYLNQAGRQLLGFSAGESHLAQEFIQVHPPDVACYLRDVALPAAIHDGAWSGEGALLTRTGELIPVSQVIIAHKEPDGQVEYFATIQRDIRPQKQAEAALREREEFFRSAFEDAPIGMALVDLQGRMLRVNAALADMLGYSPDELIAAGHRAITHPDDRGRDRPPDLRGATAPFHREKRYLHKQGHEVWGHLSISMVTDAAGQPQYYITHVEDITERKQYERQLMHLASYDPLTELFNRRRFQEELEAETAAARRGELRGAVLFIDLDQFKYVNDTLGHHAGDELLTSVANLLRSLFHGPECTVARLGGDEFAVIITGASPEAARMAADALVARMQSFAPEVMGQQVRITASVGIAVFPDHGTSAAELLARADFAMYQAKEHGRNRGYLFCPEADAVSQAEAKLTWERRIREAIEQDRFALWYQPILDLQTGRAEHCELLLRMTGDDGEPIAPGHFLPVAERFGLIQTIDRWVVREAIGLLAREQGAGRWWAVEVNLSGLAFQDPELLSLIRHELRATGADPAGLIMEITETAAIADLDAAREFVVTLRNLGCRFAIDDFGSGFASFAYLKHLPVDYLKIDGSFIRNLATDPVDQHLVRGMVEVARGLGKQTIAEFVGDEATLGLLREYGVDYAQGYHVGRPRPYSRPVAP